MFREEDWAATKRLLADRLRNRGYAKASVEGRALVDVKTQLANLTLTVAPGRRYAFGDIQVDTEPGARIPAYVVWEQVHLAIEAGRPFSDGRLEEAQRRLFGMGVFATIRVAPGEADEANGRIPVRVIVREGPFRTLRLGGGARADAIRNEARLVGDWSHRDFLGGMRKLTVHAELGWAFLPNVYAVATDDQSVGPRNGPIARLRFEFEQPRFFGRPSLRWRNSLEIDRTLEQAYNALSNRLMTGVVWQWLSTLSIFPAYRLEADYLDGAPINSAATAPLTLGCETTNDHCFVWLSYLDTLIQWDRRDHVFEPRKGTYLSLDVQGGGGPLGGDFDYVRVLPDARAYYSFGEREGADGVDPAALGRAVAVVGEPRRQRGGDALLRGRLDLDARLLRPAPVAAAAGAAAARRSRRPGDGADRRQRHDRRQLRGALLADARRCAWRPSSTSGRSPAGASSPADIPHVLWAVGVGIRWITPIGPIRVDLARRLPFGDLPMLYAVDADDGRDRADGVQRERQLLRAVRLERGDAGDRQPVRAPHRDRRGVLMRTAWKVLRIASKIALVVLAVVALVVGAAWSLLQTRRGGELVRRFALTRVNDALAGHDDARAVRIRRRSADPRETSRSTIRRCGSWRGWRGSTSASRRSRCCAGTSTWSGWRSGGRSCSWWRTRAA